MSTALLPLIVGVLAVSVCILIGLVLHQDERIDTLRRERYALDAYARDLEDASFGTDAKPVESDVQ